MTEDIKREREGVKTYKTADGSTIIYDSAAKKSNGESHGTALLREIHDAIYSHLDRGADQNSWSVARAAVEAVLCSTVPAERWKDIAYNENERAGQLGQELNVARDALGVLKKTVEKLERKIANSEASSDATEVLARIENYLRDVEERAGVDQVEAETAGPANVQLHDDLMSRFSAATRARIARKFVKGAREILGAGESNGRQYWKAGSWKAGSEIYYVVDSGEVLYWCEGCSGWEESEFQTADDLASHLGAYRITAAQLPANVGP